MSHRPIENKAMLITYADSLGSNLKDLSQVLDGPLSGAFGGAINDYFRRELGFKYERPYKTSSPLWKSWKYSENSYLRQQDTIRDDMAKNKDLKVWVICGYFDLATPFFAAEWVYDHIFLEPEYQKNLSFTYYPSGHMIYLHEPSLAQFRKDAENWYKN